MRRISLTAAALAAATMLLAGCGDDENSVLVDAFEAHGASEKEAKCMIDELGEEDAEAFLDSGDETPDNAVEILAAIEECGVGIDDPGAGAESGEAPAGVDGGGAPETAGPDIADVAGCLQEAGLDATTSEGPPPRIDLIGADNGTGSLFWYADEEQAASAADQFTETFADAETFASGSVGPVGWYYRDSPEEIAVVEACLAG